MAEQPLLPPFTVKLAGRERAVRRGIALIMECLAPLKLGKDEAGTVELVLAEAINNIVEHALATTTTETEIELRGSFSENGLKFLIIDQGASMPNNAAPVTKQPNVNVIVPKLPEGGFGWFMIHALASEVHYARIGRKNHLTVLIPVGL